jgi:hypothetical protein
MAHQYLNDGEEEEARARSANEPERRDAAHEDVPVEETSSHVDDIATKPVTPRRPRRARGGGASETPGALSDAEADEVILPSREDDLRDLESQGFTRDEANRLIDLSARINEGISNEPTLKRLQFARWLVQRGLLDEFSLRSE